METLEDELKYLQSKLNQEIKKARSGKTSTDEKTILEQSIMIRQARISEIKSKLQGLSKHDLLMEKKIGSQYNTPEKSYTSRVSKSSSAGWNFKKDYWSK